MSTQNNIETSAPGKMSPRVFDHLLRTCLKLLFQRAFETCHPGRALRDNWHLDLFAYQGERFSRGEIDRLLINVMPRTLKSFFLSVVMPAWMLGHDPSLAIMCISHSDRLCHELGDKFRAVVNSDWYKRVFPAFKITSESQDNVVTSQFGGRSNFSMEGRPTGHGFDVMFLDDPLDTTLAFNSAAIERVVTTWRNTIVSRANDPTTARMALAMQRVAPDDLSGYLLETEPGDWTHVNLQAIATEEQRHQTGKGRYYTRAEGELLEVVRFPLAEMERRKRSVGSFAFETQYQQNPLPTQGKYFDVNWVISQDKLPDREGGKVITSWDTAATTGKNSSYSAGITFLALNKSFYIMDVFLKKLGHVDLVKAIVAQYKHHRPDNVLIERASTGITLPEYLAKEGIFPTSIRPDKDKLTRFTSVTPLFEDGRVIFPKDAPWLAGLLRDLVTCDDKHPSDQVDALSQGLTWASRPEGFRYLGRVTDEDGTTPAEPDENIPRSLGQVLAGLPRW